ncbi:hypothetical protein EJB05_12156, partial [Eragrostis curvula]
MDSGSWASTRDHDSFSPLPREYHSAPPQDRSGPFLFFHCSFASLPGQEITGFYAVQVILNLSTSLSPSEFAVGH